MRAHLLNWVLGPAFLGASIASYGCNPPLAPPSLTDWLGILRAVAGFAGFFAATGLILTVLMAVAQRLMEGLFIWAEVRIFAIAIAVKMALLVFVLGMLLSIYQLAVAVTGGWQGGWQAATVGAAVGLLVGLGIAWLRLSKRLGIDKCAESNAADEGNVTG